MTKISDKAFKAAMVDALPSVWRFALSLSGTADVADDLVQATSLRALERPQQLYDVSGTKRWMFTICRSIWYNELRSRTVRRAQSLDASHAGTIAAELCPPETNIFLTEVLSEVMALPEAQRSVVVLVLVEGHSYRDAADVLDIPIGTVMSRLSSARRKLGKVFGPDAGHKTQESLK